MAPCLQGQHRPSAPVGVTWRFDAPDSTAMLTPRRSLSSLASLQLKGLYGDFDAALVGWRRQDGEGGPPNAGRAALSELVGLTGGVRQSRRRPPLMTRSRVWS